MIKTHPKFVCPDDHSGALRHGFFWMILRTSGFSGGSRLWAWLYQVTYTLIVAIMVMNLVIAVILESYEDHEGCPETATEPGPMAEMVCVLLGRCGEASHDDIIQIYTVYGVIIPIYGKPIEHLIWFHIAKNGSRDKIATQQHGLYWNTDGSTRWIIRYNLN